jgi:small GTP-binding protein
MGLWERLVNWLKSMLWAKELELTVLGLQNAGKSTFVNVLATNQFDEDTIPTIGFNYRQVRKGGVQIKIWDLGGQPRFRESWEKYCRNVDCIVYIVDSADFGNLEIARGQLHQLLAYPSLAGTPLLVLGNKNDLEGALNEEELTAQLHLHSILGREVACYSVSAKNLVNLDVTLRYLSSVPSRRSS